MIKDLNSSTPPAPPGACNVEWQEDASTPRNVSGHVPAAAENEPGVISLDGDATHVLHGDGIWREEATGSSDAVTSVAGKTGAVTLAEADVSGLVADLAATEKIAHKSQPNGYPSLDGTGKVPAAQLPTYPSVPVTSVAGKIGAVTLAESDIPNLTADLATKANAASLARVATSGDYNDLWNKPAIVSTPVTSVAGKVGAVSLVEADIANLIADLAGKVSITVTVNGHPLSSNITIAGSELAGQIAQSQVTNLTTDLAARAMSSSLAAAALAATTAPPNQIYAGPASGAVAATPIFRVLAPADMSFGVNNQTGTTYTVLVTDNSKLIVFNNAAAVAVTLPAAATFPAGFNFAVANLGAGKVTITPTTSTIDTKTTLVLSQFQGAEVYQDNINYATVRGSGGTSIFTGPVPTPTVIQSGGANSGLTSGTFYTATSCVYTLPNPVTQGNLIIVGQVGVGGAQWGNRPWTLHDNLGTNYSQVVSTTPGNESCILWIGIAAASGTCTLTSGWSIGGGPIQGVGALEVAGSAGVVDVTNVGSTYGNYISANLTTTCINDLVIGLTFGAEWDDTPTAGAGFTMPVVTTQVYSESGVGNTGGSLGLEYALKATPGPITVSFGGNDAQYSTMVSAAFKASNSLPAGAADGSWYLCTTTSILYGPVVNGVWPSTGYQLPPLTVPANTVMAGPVSGAAAAPVFRSLAAGDMAFGVNNQVGTSYAIQASDNGKLITFKNAAAVAVSLPSAATMPSGFNFAVSNLGAGTVTITPATSTIDGNATLVVSPGQGAEVYQDAVNYVTVRGLLTGAGSGTVTSVAASVPAEFAITGSPITASGTLAITKQTQSANFVWCGPTSGVAALPTFRALVAADMPLGVGTVTSVAVSVPVEFAVSAAITTSGTIAITKQNQNPNLVWCGPTSGGAALPTFRALVATDIPAIAESQVTNLVTDLASKVPTTTKVNGHPLSADVVVSASDITTGTLPHGQLPALLAGDIPAIPESGVTNLVTDLGNKVPTSTKVNGHPLSADVVVSASDITTGTLPHGQLPALIAADLAGLDISATKLQTKPVSASAPVDGNVLTYVAASGDWEPKAPTGGPGGGSSTLAGDTDVSLASPADNQVLTYVAADGKWENKTPTAGSSTLAADTDVAISSPADGQMLVYDAASGRWKNKAPVAGGSNATQIQGHNVAVAAPSDGQLLKWVAANNDWEPATVASGGAAPSRTSTVFQTTATLVAGATENTYTWLIGKGFTLFSVTVSNPCRLRLYSTAAARAADAGRLATVPPTAGTAHGVLLDLVLTSTTGLTWVLSPAVIGGDAANPPTGAIAYSVTNMDTSSAQISVTLNYDVEEA